jgi:Family of unknown function (DUF5407)
MADTSSGDTGSINMGYLGDIVSKATETVKQKIADLQAKGSAISVIDMFQMQMLMNHLSQLSEMSSSVVSALNSTIASMARNVKS